MASRNSLTIEDKNEADAIIKSPPSSPRHGRQVSNLPPKLRVVVLGDGQVGKSSLVSRFLTGRFCDEYLPTLEDYHETTMIVDDGRQITLEIVDTAGWYSFPAMRRLAITAGDAFLIVFTLEKIGVLHVAMALRDEIYQIKGESESTIVFVVNKSDIDASKMDVDMQYADVLCTGEKRHRFMTTSSKEESNVDEVFQEMVREYESQIGNKESVVTIPSPLDDAARAEKKEHDDVGKLAVLSGCFTRFARVDCVVNQH